MSPVRGLTLTARRKAQEALNWTVSAHLDGNTLVVRFEDDGHLVAPTIEKATFGRATSVTADQAPDCALTNGVFKAQVLAGSGNWNLRIVARADDGTRFQQRIVVEVLQ